MSDLADNAAPTIEALAAAYEAAARGKCGPERDPRFDGCHCCEDHCGVEIPRARLKMGKVRCRDCQELKERGKL
jgi:RNA polymerase-binding transcription factor DksA